MADMTRVMGIVGWKNSGKTRLVTDLVTHFSAAGLAVSTVKHAHHAFEIDRPGKDSFLHREAGAQEVLVASENRFALIREHRGVPAPDLAALVARMADADLILAEGFKTGRHPKMEVWRDGKDPLLALAEPDIVGVIAPDPSALPPLPCPVLRRDDLAAIASAVLAEVRPDLAG